MEPLLDCARAHASEGEIVESLQQVFGDYPRRPSSRPQRSGRAAAAAGNSICAGNNSWGRFATS